MITQGSIFIIAVGVIIGSLILYKNIKNEFQPYLWSKFELFCTGFIITALMGWAVLNERIWSEMTWIIIVGIVAGLGLAFSAPRNWEWVKNEQKNVQN